jgi:hypothetical protein
MISQACSSLALAHTMNTIQRCIIMLSSKRVVAEVSLAKYYHHLKRQLAFVMKCMSDFKRRNKTWVLLTDVDEYVTFNNINEDDPNLQMDEAPDGIPTLSDWKFQKNSVGGGIVKGTANGELVSFGVKSQDVQYGNVIQDSSGNKYFLRDDFAFRDLTVMPQAPGVPTLKQSHIRDGKLYANIYNDRYDGHNDGEQVEIETNWREPDTPAKGSTVIDGGHLVKDTIGRTYYVEREIALLPPQLNTRWAIETRRRLPSVGNDATIQDVLEDVFRDGHAREALGSCLAMPRTNGLILRQF